MIKIATTCETYYFKVSRTLKSVIARLYSITARPV